MERDGFTNRVEVKYNQQRNKYDKIEISGRGIFNKINSDKRQFFISFKYQKVTKVQIETFTGSISPSPSMGNCSTLEKTGLKGEGKIVITDVMTLGECWF